MDDIIVRARGAFVKRNYDDVVLFLQKKSDNIVVKYNILVSEYLSFSSSLNPHKKLKNLVDSLLEFVNTNSYTDLFARFNLAAIYFQFHQYHKVCQKLEGFISQIRVIFDLDVYVALLICLLLIETYIHIHDEISCSRIFSILSKFDFRVVKDEEKDPISVFKFYSIISKWRYITSFPNDSDRLLQEYQKFRESLKNACNYSLSLILSESSRASSIDPSLVLPFPTLFSLFTSFSSIHYLFVPSLIISTISPTSVKYVHSTTSFFFSFILSFFSAHFEYLKGAYDRSIELLSELINHLKSSFNPPFPPPNDYLLRLSTSPSFLRPLIYNNMGCCYFRMGQSGPALMWFSSALKEGEKLV
jgi:tetratricopeptide (TPR) repeat protein